MEGNTPTHFSICILMSMMCSLVIKVSKSKKVLKM